MWAQMQREGGGGVHTTQMYTGAQINFGDLIWYLTYGLPLPTTTWSVDISFKDDITVILHLGVFFMDT